MEMEHLPLDWLWVADDIAKMALCPWCHPFGNIMVFEQLRLKERYPTVFSIYSFVKLRERILRHCVGTFLKEVERQKHSSTM